MLQEGQKLLYRGGLHAASCLNWLLSKDTAFRCTALILLQEGQKLLYRGGFHAASCLNWLLSKDTQLDCLYSAARGTKTTVSWWFPCSIMSKLTAFERYTIGLPLYCCKRDKNYCVVVVSTQHHVLIDCFWNIHDWTAFILLQKGQKLLCRGGFHAESCPNWLLSKDTRLDCLYSAARGTKTTVLSWFPRSIMSELTAFERYTIGLPLVCCKRDKSKLLYCCGFHAASCLNWPLLKDTRLDCLYSAARGTKTTVSWWFLRSIISKLTAFERYCL